MSRLGQRRIGKGGAAEKMHQLVVPENAEDVSGRQLLVRGGGRRRQRVTARSRGFTIVEVLVALSIFAGAAVVLGAAYINVLNGYEIVGRATQVDQEAKFARAMLLAEPDIEKARTGAEFESTDGRRVRWSATIEPTELPDLFSVVFECETSGGALREPVKVQNVFRTLRPTWSEPAERETLRTAVRERITKLQENLNK